MDKDNYERAEEGDTVIETWEVEQPTTRWGRAVHYKLKVTVAGVPQRTRTYQYEDMFASARTGAFWTARRRDNKTVITRIEKSTTLPPKQPYEAPRHTRYGTLNPLTTPA